MIDRKELREGNYVLSPISEICKIKISDIYQGFNVDCYPVPITEEILLKCGFRDEVPWAINWQMLVIIYH